MKRARTTQDRSCGAKSPHPSPGAASAAIQSLRSRGNFTPMTYFRCIRCGSYHIVKRSSDASHE